MNPVTGGVSIGELTRVRAQRPEAVRDALARRRRRPLLGERSRLMIVAADHPARGSLGAGDRPLAMANRLNLLERLCLALSRPGVDGVLGTADILEDLALLGALDGKVAIGSMNRGGLAGASFEMDDRFTGYGAADIDRSRLDGGKLLLRVDPDDPGSLSTMEASARAVDELSAHGLMAMVEPFLASRVDGKVRNDLSAAAVTRSIAIASGLGGTSAHTWLKIPLPDDSDDLAEVVEATTLPTLLLGGEVSADVDRTYERWRQALRIPSVHGLVVGRSLLYPPDDDVTAAADAAAGLL